MKDPNFNFLKSKFQISEATYEILKSLSTYKFVKRGEILVAQGAIGSSIAFIASRLMRSYLVFESGKEITKNIFSDFSFVGPYSSILRNEPSLFTHQALVDTSLYEIDLPGFIARCKKNLELSILYNRILEHIFIVYEKKYLNSVSLNATQRYLMLKQQIPNLDAMVTQYQIASLLNISAVQLSRIKKELPKTLD